MLTLAPSVLVKQDKTIIEGGFGNTANWVDIDNGSTVPDRLGIGHGQALRGFQVTPDHRTLVFAEGDLGWKEVKLAALSLWILEDGVPKLYTDLNTFMEEYQAVLILD